MLLTYFYAHHLAKLAFLLVSSESDMFSHNVGQKPDSRRLADLRSPRIKPKYVSSQSSFAGCVMRTHEGVRQGVFDFLVGGNIYRRSPLRCR